MAGGTTLLVLLNDTTAPLPAGQLAVGVGNKGTASISVGTLVMTGATTRFTIVTDPVSNTTLLPGEQRRVIVSADTTTVGTHVASIRIPSSDPDGSLTVALLSVVIAPAALVPGITVDPSGTVSFGNVDITTGTSVKVFTVSSSGTGPLVMGAVTVTGLSLIHI